MHVTAALLAGMALGVIGAIVWATLGVVNKMS